LKGGFDGSRGGSWREAWMEEEVVADWLIKKLLLNGGAMEEEEEVVVGEVDEGNLLKKWCGEI